MEERLNQRRARRRLTRAVGLIILGIALGFGIWRGVYATPVQVPTSESPPATEVDLPTEAPPTNDDAEGELPASSLRLTSPARPQFTVGTPADAWAEAVLTIAFPEINDAPAPLDGLAWWQSRDVSGVLSINEDRQIMLGSRMVDATAQEGLLVRVPDPNDPRQLTTIGDATLEGVLLNLSTEPIRSPFTIQRWSVSNGNVQIALQALAQIAEENELSIIAAYAPNNAQTAELALIGLERTGEPAATPTATGTVIPTLTPYPTPTPTHTPEPTPTREPDAYLERLVGVAVATFIEQEPRITSNAVYEFAFGHPRTGVLTWTEFGGRVGGREMALDGAEDLTIYSLLPDDTSGGTERLFYAFYDGATTRIPAEQVYFQGQRMSEITYWMVRRAFQEGGQLVIVYDDFGSTQAITLIGFEPFPNDPTP